MGRSIFLSYRRGDSQAIAGRLADDLGAAFGPERILFDRDLPDPGLPYADAVDQTLAGCAAVVVVIGPAFRARLQDPRDFVRQEIARGLASGLPVLPVLVNGAAMPAAAELPDDLTGLAFRQALAIDTGRWRSDVAALVEALRRVAGEAARPVGVLAGLRKLLDAGPPAPAQVPPARRAAPAPAPPPPAKPAAARDIFISYAFEDEAWAQQVVATLEGQGYTCWIASRDIVPGSASYAREITRAIKSVRLLVVVLSAATNGSDDVLNEITLAKNNGVPRLPLRVDASAMDEGLEYYFSQAQRLESATQDPAELLQRLARAVAQQLGSPRPAG